MPKVSIILPNLNQAQFLPERINTIINQSFKDWECIIIDGHSTDGSLDIFNNLIEKDKRFTLNKREPKGVYDAWNFGISLAQGEFIYIATADDTMTTNFLDKMLCALKENPDCHIAECNLKLIDENSVELPENKQWVNFESAQFLKEYIFKPHKRIAPYDGLLYTGDIGTIYTSITGLLVKTEVYRKHGLFLTNVGNIADFEWGARMGLCYNIIHIPSFLATWRIHDTQLTRRTSIIKEDLLINRLNLLHLAKENASKILNYSNIIKNNTLIKREIFFSRFSKKQKHVGTKLALLILLYKHPIFVSSFIIHSFLNKIPCKNELLKNEIIKNNLINNIRYI